MASDLTLHHLNYSRSHRVLWLLEELGLDYKLKTYERNKATMLAPPELRKIHPLGKSPLLTHNDRVVAESAVIIEYLLDQKPDSDLRPQAGTQEFQRYFYWMHYAEGSMMPPLLLSLAFSSLSSNAAPLPARPLGAVISKAVHVKFLDRELKNHGDYVDGELAKTPWLAGENFTAADIQMSFPIEAFESRVGLGGRKNLARYLAAIRARPAYQKALELGGPVVL